ncbi:fungal-specific transcription factor domain-containing protein [Aspergillus carlsbadensis]|nr:fungal-specific transcription factor domain-containing protein [Aspergillus carlsbadensis]
MSGSMHCSAKGTVYVSSAHWISIMDSISELRECIENPSASPELSHQLPLTKPDTDSVPHLLSARNATTTKSEILQAMPDRSVVDRHVFWYFNRQPLVFIHTPSFLRQYETFWENPSAAPVLWLSILFGIMCLTPLDHVASPPLPGDTATSRSGLYQPLYLTQIMQCLVLGDYSRGGPFAVEALFCYFVVEHSRRCDTDASNWSLYGLIVRLALRKGYHREPSLFPNITPYEGELRRRLWMMLYFVDVVISIQMGLPRLIKDEQCDAGLPHNLLDSDFGEDTKPLPTPRPDTEITPIQFWVARYKLLIIIARIADMSLITTGNPCSGTKVKDMDTLLRTTYDQLPPVMKFTSLVACLGASPDTTANRLSVSILFQKGLIILHRGYVVGGGSSENIPVYTPHKHSASCASDSTRTCIDAALQMLEYQDFFYHESQEGGALAPMGWRLRSSTIAHEFLTATSVLCSYMYRVYIGDPDISQLSPERMQAVEQALVRTHGIWQSQMTWSKDAQRATEILGVLIAKLQGCAGAPRMDDLLHIRLESQSGDVGALLHDNFGLPNEEVNDFSSFIAW